MTVRMPRAGGFTLLELMVTVAVLAILAAVVYPSYLDQVRKSRRADAKSALLSCAQMLERHHTQVGHYAAAGDPEVASACTGKSPHGYYALPASNVASGASAATFSIRATPTGSQVTDPCGSFTYTDIGTRDVTGGRLKSKDCW